MLGRPLHVARAPARAEAPGSRLQAGSPLAPPQAETVVDVRCEPCSAVAASISSNHAWCSRLTRHASSMSPAAMASTIG